jgi:hypothetical protein
MQVISFALGNSEVANPRRRDFLQPKILHSNNGVWVCSTGTYSFNAGYPDFFQQVWDRCYDLKNIFAKKVCETIGVFSLKLLPVFSKTLIIATGF